MLHDRRKHGRPRSMVAWALVCLATSACAVVAQDRGPLIIGQRKKMVFFGLQDFDSSIEAFWRYRLDETTPTNGPTTRDTESLFRETLQMRTKGFFGDPNLIKLDLDVWVQLSQEEFDSDTNNSKQRTSETIAEFDLNSLILRRSKMPLTLYARRSQVLLDRQFAESLDSYTSEQGARLTVRSELMPNQLQFFHREQEQTGRLSGTDFALTQDTIAWQGRFKPMGGHQIWWDYTYSSVDEAGQLQVPNTFERQDAFLNHTLDFGSKSQHRLRSRVRFFKETGRFPVDRFRWIESLLLVHNPDFETKYEYTFDQQQRITTDQTLQQATARFRHQLYDSLTTTGQVGASVLDLTNEDFQSTQQYADFNLDYRKEVPLGDLYATADLNYNLQDDSDRGTAILLTNVPETFDASGLITINRRNIVTSSIVVTDTTGIVIFVEGADYTVQLFGETVEIRRVTGGSITSGQSVLLRYEIGPEPESTIETLGYGITVRYRFEEGVLRGLSPYIRFRDQNQDRSGPSQANLPTNDFEDVTVGVDYDFWRFFLSAERQVHESTISPFELTRFEGRYSQRLSRRNSLMVNAFYQETDRTDENFVTRVTNVTTRWNTQITNRMRSNLVGVWRREEDSGGTDSDAFEIALDLTWQYRQTSAYCNIRNSFVNSSTRDSTFQTLEVGFRRNF